MLHSIFNGDCMQRAQLLVNPEDVAELAGLGSEQKFCLIEQLARRRLAEARDEAEQGSPYGNISMSPKYTEHDYAVLVSAAAIEFGITELADFELPYPTDETSERKCRMYRAQATQVSQRLLFRHGTNNATVGLDASTKEKIGHWLKQMREAVQAADVAREKKDRLFALIDQLQAEVDRERTPVHAAGQLWVTICTYMGEGAKKALEPATPLIERICGALGLAKKAEEAQSKRLPPAKETKRIEGPNALKRNGSQKMLDEEIPF